MGRRGATGADTTPVVPGVAVHPMKKGRFHRVNGQVDHAETVALDVVRQSVCEIGKTKVSQRIGKWK